MALRNPWCDQFEVAIAGNENRALFLTHSGDQWIRRIDRQNVTDMLDLVSVQSKDMGYRIRNVMIEQQRD